MSEQTGITEFRFKICGRCGHPPSDGPCIMGNAEHAQTHEHGYASFSAVRELAVSLGALQDEIRAALDMSGQYIDRLERIERAISAPPRSLRSGR
jgi:hypothetical protein